MAAKVLVVDDEEVIRALLCQRLEGLGISDFSQAASGNEVIARLEAGRRYDLIISDQRMANGTGMDIFNYMSERNIQCPFLFFTGTPIALSSQEKWFLGIVHKLDLQKLEEKVAQAFYGASPQPERI